MSISILLIEDDKTINKMYQEKFSKAGYEVIAELDGLNCFPLAKKRQPLCILLDVVLPRIDGFDILKKLKKDPATAHIPVVLLTNLSSEEDKQLGLRLGAAEYLVKSDYTPSEIVEKINALTKDVRTNVPNTS
jgi:DNA-binding response OmpR family regulator